MADKEVVTSGGIGVGGLLFVALIVLKCMGYIIMSWFWVLTSIIWIPLCLILAWVIIVFIIALIAGLIATFFG